MADSRFFDHNGSITLKELLNLTGAKIYNSNNISDEVEITDVSPIETAEETHLSFLISAKYLTAFKASKAGFCFVNEKFADKAPNSMVVLVHNNPYKAYAIIASKFYENKSIFGNISKNAVIAKTSKIGKNCYIGNFVVIEDEVIIGDNCYIDHNTVIKKSVVIGDSVRIASNVTISHAIIGDDVIIHPGAKIGQDGFGFASDASGHLKVPQLGLVKIGNKVEIGANTTIDRGSSQDTVIADMVQIDNLVQLGHNVKVGKASVIVAQVGIAGSTKIGDFSILGGQVGVSGHLNIGSGVQVAAQSGVTKDIDNGQVMGGYPAVPVRQWHRQTSTLAKISKNQISSDNS
jgi:UDP-3-O-[3-hydroxymyristoyl] glucosamine N-acyltransferase